jgi:hypothetical protein
VKLTAALLLKRSTLTQQQEQLVLQDTMVAPLRFHVVELLLVFSWMVTEDVIWVLLPWHLLSLRRQLLL